MNIRTSIVYAWIPAFVGMTALFCLAGCVSSFDLQGEDPNEYYAEHPIKNTLETRSKSAVMYFEPGRSNIPQKSEDSLRSQLHGVSMAAVESIVVGLPARDMRNNKRKAAVARVLRHVGYHKDDLTFEEAVDVPDNHASIFVQYAAVVLPDCPDWRRSPVTSYSNTRQGNFNCAHEVNLGLMIADPHDLVEGGGKSEMDTERASRAVQNYRSGTGTTSSSTSGSASASSAAAPATAAAPTPQ